MGVASEYKKSLQQAWFNLAARLPIEDIKVEQRLDRAKEIVRSLGMGYSIKSATNGYRVYKESTSLLEDNSVIYWVDRDGCSCPDGKTARAGLCKHRLATMLIEEMLVG